MTGKELRIAIRNSGIKIAVIASDSGIPEPTIYSLYRKREVELHYLDKIENAGVKIQKNIKNNENKHSEYQDHSKSTDPIKRLENEVFKLRGEVEFLKWKMNEIQEEAVEQKLEFKKIKDMWVTYEKKKEPTKLQGKRSS